MPPENPPATPARIDPPKAARAISPIVVSRHHRLLQSPMPWVSLWSISKEPSELVFTVIVRVSVNARSTHQGTLVDETPSDVDDQALFLERPADRIDHRVVVLFLGCLFQVIAAQ